MRPRFALKQATEAVHERLDSLMGQLDLANRDDYAAFLAIHAEVLPPYEDALAAAGLGEHLPSWEEQRRTRALAADLATLGVTVAEIAAVPPLDHNAMLGAAYAIEGSRLGGQVLARHVGDGLPAAFLKVKGNDHLWTELSAVLNDQLRTDTELAEAEAAALQVFNAYLDAAGRKGLKE